MTRRPWLTILVVGHLVVPLALAVETNVMTVWPMLALGAALVVVPRAKGLLLSVILVTRAPGSEREGELEAEHDGA
ncbi:DUF983 domain-containing protein [Mesorhizobium australicum]|uniref:DUF983 domain-containing protein n=1 Tax=Mesorhizobium australicum TaxID=536018 RepID=UPI0003CF3454|nr:hypothetical protein X739_31595 [Mesorhizobium sp. LNHC220B00]